MTALNRNTKGAVSTHVLVGLIVADHATTAVVETQKADGSLLQAAADARLSPGDKFDARVGSDLALARALRKLANKLDREYRRKGLIQPEGVNVGPVAVSVQPGSVIEVKTADVAAGKLPEILRAVTSNADAPAPAPLVTGFVDGQVIASAEGHHWFRQGGKWWFFSEASTQPTESTLDDDSILRIFARDSNIELLEALPVGTVVRWTPDRSSATWHKHTDGNWYYGKDETWPSVQYTSDAKVFADLRDAKLEYAKIPDGPRH